MKMSTRMHCRDNDKNQATLSNIYDQHRYEKRWQSFHDTHSMYPVRVDTIHAVHLI